ncbi:MAG: tetratricopeptide repeat protein [Bacteroidales bacterium]|nr:tetratricopeptide repeat protein [Bacteroidales bacterium]
MDKVKAYHFFRQAAVWSLLIILLGCSTKKNTFTRRWYHNLTSHYNVYWNGKEAMIEAEKELEATIKDNYNMTLPMFNYGTEKESKGVTPLLDRAIEKGSKTILKHSMRFGGKEYVRWIDDAYMLIGKAYFYKQDYFSARRSFSFVMREYEKNEIKYDAMLWLARTYIELEQFEKSEPMLNLINIDMASGEARVSNEVYKYFPLVYADHYIKQERYTDAIDFLYDGIATVGKKDAKTRAKFILAQIFQEEGDLDQASQLYGEVIRRNPTYDMAFQAKINMARSYEADNGDSRTIIKYLDRMLRDDKNQDYKDQIYYALAEVAFKDGQDSLGVEYLRLSVARSVNNDYQKSTSALELADHYFAIPEYELSQAYYDTAVNILPEDYPNFEEIKLKATELSELVSNLQVIQLEDSLQMLVALPEQERLAVIDEIIQDLIEEERRKLEEEEQKQNLAAFDQGSSGFTGMPIGGAKWYFYNNQALSNGYTEFIRKWGNRKLEDLWRLKNKQVINFAPDEELEETIDSLAMAGDTLGALALDPHNREYYLKDLPFSEKALAESNMAISQAFYNLGLIYGEGLNDPLKAIEAFEELIERYPDDPNKLRVYYQLYRLNIDRNNPERSDYYKNLIIGEYPESDYARIILDPDYFKSLADQVSELSVLYENTYIAYKRGQYFTVIGNTDRALRTYGDSADLIPKFLYLKALSVGKVDVVDSMATVLKVIISDYASSDVSSMATELLNYIARDRPDLGTAAMRGESKEPEIVFPFTFNPSENHLYLLVVKRAAIKLNAMKVRISDHNKKYYSIRNLTVNSVLLDDVRYMITVGNFENAEEAMDYYERISGDAYVFGELGTGNFTETVISIKNYPIFYREKDVDLYKKFFEKNYLGN